MPVQHFLQECPHHPGLKYILLPLLFSKNGSEEVGGCDPFAHCLNISGDQAATTGTGCCDTTQTNARMRREDGLVRFYPCYGKSCESYCVSALRPEGS